MKSKIAVVTGARTQCYASSNARFATVLNALCGDRNGC